MKASWTCWNSIGVSGDGSCPDLPQYVHCRNCPVYSTAARTVLDGKLPATYQADWTRHFAQPKAVADVGALSLLIFRIAAEWLAISTPTVWEVTDLRPIHALPHRAAGVVLGLVNVRGELLVCVSLGRLLGLESRTQALPAAARPARQRLLVIRGDGVRVVCPADEVDGIHRVHARDVRALPSTVAHADAPHSRGVMTALGRSVGVLDDQRLIHAIKQGVA